MREGLAQVFPRVWRYALSLTGARAEADDLAQAACLRAMERADQFSADGHLDRWVFRIAHNLWVSEIRKQKVRRGNGLIGIEVADIVDPTQNAEMQQQRRELLQSVLHLPEAQRHTVILVYVEGYSYRDAAMILDVPIGTVMSRLAAARATLSNKFRAEEKERDAR
ncbi:RNA polymerase sigma factor [Phaeobacter sp.]|uniref:RNA polymerase sigma factor n=1 Tax=Phaeobacter sp. TaxID=1902409 RepID=UPI0025CDB3FD|nr:RNA polymerase sigma factor [Phaeobacter sp.]